MDTRSPPQPFQSPSHQPRVRFRWARALGAIALMAVPVVLASQSAEIIGRVAFLYFFLLLMLRLLGKRELAELSPFELTLIMFIPEIASQALSGGDLSLEDAVAGLSTMFALVLLTSVVTYRFKKVRDWVEGEPTILVANGRLQPERLDHERVSIDDIMSEIRGAGLEKFADAKWVILEPEGKISVIAYERDRALTQS